MKDAFYFPHDSNAQHDPKICALRCVYGMRGYGMYWVLIEMLREQSDFRLRLNGPYSAEVYAKKMDCTTEEAVRFVEDCIRSEDNDGFGLFSSDGKYFWSESLIRRMGKREKEKERKSELGKRAAQARWGHEERNADAMRNDTKKGKERKGKEKKGEEKRRKDIYSAAQRVLEYLNTRAKRRYTTIHKYTTARLKEHSEEDLRMVIDAKTYEWGSDAKMRKYLRQETLFGPEKFPGYLDEAGEVIDDLRDRDYQAYKNKLWEEHKKNGDGFAPLSKEEWLHVRQSPQGGDVRDNNYPDPAARGSP